MLWTILQFHLLPVLSSTMCQKVPQPSIIFHIFLYCSIRFHRVPGNVLECSATFYYLPSSSMFYRMVLEHSRRFQEVPLLSRMFHHFLLSSMMFLVGFHSFPSTPTCSIGFHGFHNPHLLHSRLSWVPWAWKGFGEGGNEGICWCRGFTNACLWDFVGLSACFMQDLMMVWLGEVDCNLVDV